MLQNQKDNPKIIEIKDMSYKIANKKILYDINLDIHKHELLTIVGPNGAGKSSLLRLLLGHIKPSSGLVQRQKELKIAYIPQKFLPPRDFPITVKRFLKDLNIPEDDADNPLIILNILHLLDRPLKSLSGGETQRLLLARAILTNPDLIALDEPAAGIDPSALSLYYKTIRNYQLKNKTAIVMVSHDLHLVMAASDRVVCLNGHLCCAGKPRDIAGHPDYLALLGSESADIIGVYTHHHNHVHN